jgi:truncated hemoglobin YjbI
MHGKSGIGKALLQNHKQCEFLIDYSSSPINYFGRYRKRHLKKYLDDFTEQMHRTMGCRVVILASHKKTADQTLSVIV